MTHSEYVLAWAIYLGAASVLYLWVHLVSKSWRWSFPRTSFRGLAAVFLFTPAISEAGTDLLGPANLVMSIALLQHDFSLVDKAAANFAIFTIIVILLVALKATVEKLFPSR